MNDPEEESSPSRREAMSPIGAMIHIRCPECKKGIVFRHGMEMNRLCPYCGIKFDREPGYFTGAIWISIILALPVMLFLMFGFVYFFRSMHPALSGVLAAFSFIPLVPITIRISRSIWMYLDHQMHPQRPDRMPPDDRGGEYRQPVPEGSGDGMAADPDDAVTQEEQQHAHRVDAIGEEMLTAIEHR